MAPGRRFFSGAPSPRNFASWPLAVFGLRTSDLFSSAYYLAYMRTALACLISFNSGRMNGATEWLRSKVQGIDYKTISGVGCISA